MPRAPLSITSFLREHAGTRDHGNWSPIPRRPRNFYLQRDEFHYHRRCIGASQMHRAKQTRRQVPGVRGEPLKSQYLQLSANEAIELKKLSARRATAAGSSAAVFHESPRDGVESQKIGCHVSKVQAKLCGKIFFSFLIVLQGAPIDSNDV